MNKVAAVRIAATVAIAATVLYAFVAMPVASQPGDADEFREWCDDQGGEALHVQAFINGGLNCHLSDGDLAGSETVHIDEWRQEYGGASA